MANPVTPTQVATLINTAPNAATPAANDTNRLEAEIVGFSQLLAKELIENSLVLSVQDAIIIKAEGETGDENQLDLALPGALADPVAIQNNLLTQLNLPTLGTNVIPANQPDTALNPQLTKPEQSVNLQPLSLNQNLKNDNQTSLKLATEQKTAPEITNTGQINNATTDAIAKTKSTIFSLPTAENTTQNTAAEQTGPATNQSTSATTQQVAPSALQSNHQNTLPIQNKLTVDPPVGSTGWDQSVGQKVVWLVTNQQQSAQLHLNPPNLGPVDVSLTINKDQATAVFTSHQTSVRDAIENAIPRLREILADNGINLGNVMVSSESFQGQTQTGEQSRSSSSNASLQLSEPNLTSTAAVIQKSGEGLVDTFV